MTAIDDIKQKIDILQVIGQYTKLSKAGRQYRGLCPFHSEKTPSFFVSPEQQSWHCFGACSTGGDVFSFLMKKEGLEFREALESLAEKVGVELPHVPQQKESKEEKHGIYEVNAAAAQFYYEYFLTAPAARKAREYAASRGFSRKSIEDFQVGLSPENREALRQHLAGKGFGEPVLVAAGLLIETGDGRRLDRFHGRLMFPIRDARGQTTGFGARALDDSQPKYLNSPQTPVFDKSATLYGIDLAAPAIRKQDVAVIVEGYIDVIICHQHTISNVVASMGTSITDKQVNILGKLSKNLVLALDPDAAGEEAMLRCLGHEGTLGAEIKVMSLPEGKDPDEVLRENPAVWAEAMKAARPVVDRTFESLVAGLDLSKPGDKQAAVDRLLPVVAGINNITRQTDYTQRLARMVKVDAKVIEAEVSRVKASVRTTRPGNAPEPERRTSIMRDPLEDHCLALLIRHPELKSRSRELAPEYFHGTENRQIFLKYRELDDPSRLGEALDPLIAERLEGLKAQRIPDVGTEERFADCSLRLRERFLKDLEARRADLLAAEAESGKGADLALLQQEGIQTSIKLREIHKTRGKR